MVTKRNILLSAVMAVLAVFAAVPAFAATIKLSPGDAISAEQGETFAVTVTIEPQSEENYTADVQLNYPADLLQVASFTLEKNWMALSRPGYDLIDNTNGQLIKTAGYPDGISSPLQFGTVTFLAKKAGSGVISLGKGSFVLDGNNKNVLANAPEVPFAITASPAQAGSATTTTTTKIKTQTQKVAFVAQEAPSSTISSTISSTASSVLPETITETPTSSSSPSLLASIRSIFVPNFEDYLIWIDIVGYPALAIAGYIAYTKRRRSKR